MTSGPPAVPLPAATVVLLRPARAGAEPEVLLIERPASMAFGPGLHVFPGGRIDPEDRAAASGERPDVAARAAATLGGAVDGEEAVALSVGACREVAEEIGVTIAPNDLAPIAHWTTPAFMPRRFSTWFYAADFPVGAEPVFEREEVASHRWLAPSRALEQMASGEIRMWVPTTSVLERLIETGATTARDVGRRLGFGRVDPPRIIEEAVDRVVVESSTAGGLPGRPCRTTVWGRQRVVVVDPGDASEEALALVASASAARGAITAVVLTQPDPDHAAGAEAIAIPLEIPVLAAPGAGRRLPYAIRELADGERLPSDVDLVVELGPSESARLEVVRSAGE